MNDIIEPHGLLYNNNQLNYNLTDEDFDCLNRTIKSFPNNRLIIKSCNYLTKIGFSFLFNSGIFTELKELTINKCINFDDECLNNLCKSKIFESINYIKISRNDLISSIAFSKLFQANKTRNIIKIKFCYNNALNDEVLQNIIHNSNWYVLQYMNIKYCEKISSKSMRSLENLNELKYLNISGCKNIDDEGITYISFLKKLETLKINDLELITIESIKVITATENMINLKELEIDYCAFIDNQAIQELSNATNLINLQKLSFKQDIRITIKGIYRIIDNENFANLKTLKFDGFALFRENLDKKREIKDLIKRIDQALSESKSLTELVELHVPKSLKLKKFLVSANSKKLKILIYHQGSNIKTVYPRYSSKHEPYSSILVIGDEKNISKKYCIPLLTNVEVLILPLVKDTAAISMALCTKYFSNLVFLKIGGIPSINPLIDLFSNQNFPYLEVLDISYTLLTDEFFSILSVCFLPNLKILKLANALTNKNMYYSQIRLIGLSSYSKTLEILKLSNFTFNEHDKSIMTRSCFPNLKSLSFKGMFILVNSNMFFGIEIFKNVNLSIKSLNFIVPLKKSVIETQIMLDTKPSNNLNPDIKTISKQNNIISIQIPKKFYIKPRLKFSTDDILWDITKIFSDTHILFAKLPKIKRMYDCSNVDDLYKLAQLRRTLQGKIHFLPLKSLIFDELVPDDDCKKFIIDLECIEGSPLLGNHLESWFDSLKKAYFRKNPKKLVCSFNITDHLSKIHLPNKWESFINTFKDLQIVDLDFNNNSFGNLLVTLSRVCTSLRELILRNADLDKEGFVEFCTKGRHIYLSKLYIWNCLNLTDIELKFLQRPIFSSHLIQLNIIVDLFEFSLQSLEEFISKADFPAISYFKFGGFSLNIKRVMIWTSSFLMRVMDLHVEWALPLEDTPDIYDVLNVLGDCDVTLMTNQIAKKSLDIVLSYYEGKAAINFELDWDRINANFFDKYWKILIRMLSNSSTCNFLNKESIKKNLSIILKYLNEPEFFISQHFTEQLTLDYLNDELLRILCKNSKIATDIVLNFNFAKEKCRKFNNKTKNILLNNLMNFELLDQFLEKNPTFLDDELLKFILNDIPIDKLKLKVLNHQEGITLNGWKTFYTKSKSDFDQKIGTAYEYFDHFLRIFAREYNESQKRINTSFSIRNTKNSCVGNTHSYMAPTPRIGQYFKHSQVADIGASKFSQYAQNALFMIGPEGSEIIESDEDNNNDNIESGLKLETRIHKVPVETTNYTNPFTTEFNENKKNSEETNAESNQKPKLAFDFNEKEVDNEKIIKKPLLIHLNSEPKLLQEKDNSPRLRSITDSKQKEAIKKPIDTNQLALNIIEDESIIIDDKNEETIFNTDAIDQIRENKILSASNVKEEGPKLNFMDSLDSIEVLNKALIDLAHELLNDFETLIFESEFVKKIFLNLKEINISSLVILRINFDPAKLLIQPFFQNIEILKFEDSIFAKDYDNFWLYLSKLNNLTSIHTIDLDQINFTRCHEGSQFATYIESISFSKIKTLKICNCLNIDRLFILMNQSEFQLEIQDIYLDNCNVENIHQIQYIVDCKNLKKLTKLTVLRCILTDQLITFPIDKFLRLTYNIDEFIYSYSVTDGTKIEIPQSTYTTISNFEFVGDNSFLSGIKVLKLFNVSRGLSHLLKSFFMSKENQFIDKIDISFELFDLEDFLILIQSNKTNNLRSFKITLHLMQDRFIEWIGKKKFTRLRKLTLRYSNVNEDFEIGIKQLLRSKYLKTLDWQRFYEKHKPLVKSEKFAKIAAEESDFYSNLNFFEISHLSHAVAIKAVHKISPKKINLDLFFTSNEEFLAKHDDIFNCLMDEKFFRKLSNIDVPKLTSKKLIFKLNLLQALIKYPNQANISQLLLTYANEVDDQAMLLLGRFSDTLMYNQTIIRLNAAIHATVHNIGLNCLVQQISYANENNIYNWILVDDYWRNFIDSKSLRIIASSLTNTLIYHNNHLDFSKNLYLTSNGEYEIMKELVQSLGQRGMVLSENLSLYNNNYLDKLYDQRFTESNIKLDDECGEGVLKIIKFSPFLKRISLSNKNFGDKFCEKLSLIIISRTVKNAQYIQKIDLSNNPRITLVGLRYLYTALVGDQKINMIETKCDSHLKPYVNNLLSYGLYYALKSKLKLYTNKIKNKTICTHYDHFCLPMLLYVLICFPLAIWQLLEDNLMKYFAASKIGRLFQKKEGIVDKNLDDSENYDHLILVQEMNVPQTNKFIFTKSCIVLNTYVKSKKIWFLFLMNYAIYNFLCFFMPVYFISSCGEGHLWISHVSYLIFSVISFLTEMWFYTKVKKIIGDDGILKLNLWVFFYLVQSQIARFTKYSNMLFATARINCDDYTPGTISAIFILFHSIFIFYQILNVLIQYIRIKEEDYTTYINLLSRLLYNLYFVKIGMIFERFSTSTTVRFFGEDITQIVLTTLFTFLLQNLPQGIVQIIDMSSQNVDLYLMFFGLISTILSLISSIIHVFRAKPSMCTSEMVLAFSKSDRLHNYRLSSRNDRHSQKSHPKYTPLNNSKKNVETEIIPILAYNYTASHSPRIRSLENISHWISDGKMQLEKDNHIICEIGKSKNDWEFNNDEEQNDKKSFKFEQARKKLEQKNWLMASMIFETSKNKANVNKFGEMINSIDLINQNNINVEINKKELMEKNNTNKIKLPNLGNNISLIQDLNQIQPNKNKELYKYNSNAFHPNNLDKKIKYSNEDLLPPVEMKVMKNSNDSIFNTEKIPTNLQVCKKNYLKYKIELLKNALLSHHHIESLNQINDNNIDTKSDIIEQNININIDKKIQKNINANKQTPAIESIFKTFWSNKKSFAFKSDNNNMLASIETLEEKPKPKRNVRFQDENLEIL